MNYKDLIDRLRSEEYPVGPFKTASKIDRDFVRERREAADVIESLTAQLAAGPVAWIFDRQQLGAKFKTACVSQSKPKDSVFWSYRNVTPLYHIPLPTEE